MQFIEFRANGPQEMTLQRDSIPYTLPQGGGCLYVLSDGRIVHLNPECVRAIGDLKLGPGESFLVCLHQRGSGLAYWSVWLSPATEKARAAAEAPDLERQLAESLAIASRRRRTTVETAVDRGTLAPTGTDGPVPQLAPRKPAIAAVAGGKRRAGEPIPMNVAFREIVRFVVAELDASGEQWSDESRQDLVSTVLIAAQKANLLSVWEREDAA